MHSMSVLQAARSLLRLAAVGAVLAGLAGCGVISDEETVSYSKTRYAKKGDNKPHPGVARAHRHAVHGIDVARYQGAIDWATVRAAGTRFAFIKATEGGDYIDPNFRRNWEGARRSGIARGAYHFMYWCRPAREQAQWFVANVPRDADALPPVLDVEWNNHSRTCRRKVSREDALEKIRIMTEAMERHTGKIPVIYTDINFHRDVLEGYPLDNPMWLRSTAAEPHERYRGRRWTFWQWTQTGTVPGINHEVDRNVFYGTDQDWETFVATGCDPRDRSRLTARGACRGLPRQDLGGPVVASIAPAAVPAAALPVPAALPAAAPLPATAAAPLPLPLPAPVPAVGYQDDGIGGLIDGLELPPGD